jgi:hypothetical protein
MESLLSMKSGSHFRTEGGIAGWFTNEGPTPKTWSAAQNINQDIVCIKGLSFPVSNHQGNSQGQTRMEALIN